MNKLLILLSVLLCCGCGDQRAQQAADIREGIHAAEIAAKTGDSEKVLAILPGADARLSACAEVPSMKFPPARMKAAEIVADPQKYVTSAPPESKGWSGKLIAAVSGGGFILLAILGRIAPQLLPGAGPALVALGQGLFKAIVPNSEAKLDNARVIIHDYAPALQAFVAAVPDISQKLPEELTAAIALLAKDAAP